MSKLLRVQALIVAGLLIAAGAMINTTMPTAVMACSDPPCRAK